MFTIRVNPNFYIEQNIEQRKKTIRFGPRLRELRKQKNISQRNLASQVGIDFTYLSKIEQGHVDPPSEEVIRQIAQILEVDENELINLAGKVPKDLRPLLEENPLVVELLRVLSERKPPDEIYRKMLDLARESQKGGDDREHVKEAEKETRS